MHDAHKLKIEKSVHGVACAQHSPMFVVHQTTLHSRNPPTLCQMGCVGSVRSTTRGAASLRQTAQYALILAANNRLVAVTAAAAKVVAALTLFPARATVAAESIEAGIQALHVRTKRAVVRMRQEAVDGIESQIDVEQALAALVRIQAARTTAARALFQNIEDKILAERLEEAEANACLLDAVARLCEAALAGHTPLGSDTFQLGLDTLSLAFMFSAYPCSFLAVISALPSSTLHAWGAVPCWRPIDPRCCDVSGPGTTRFVVRNPSSNRIIISARCCDGTLATFVTPDDIAVSAALPLDPASSFGTVSHVTVDNLGTCLITFDIIGVLTVDSSVVVSVTVCGVAVFQKSIFVTSLFSQHKYKLRLAEHSSFLTHGLAVTPDAQYMASSCSNLVDGTFMLAINRIDAATGGLAHLALAHLVRLANAPTGRTT